MAFLRAAVGVARERIWAGGEAGESLLRAAASVCAGPTEASGGNELWAGRAGARVAEKKAAVAAAGDKAAAADLAAGVGEYPGVEWGVLELAAEAAVGSWGLGSGELVAALGAVPGGRARVTVWFGVEGGLVGPGLDAGKVEEGVAGGGARPDGVGGADPAKADEARGEGGGEERFDLGEVGGGGIGGELEVGGENGVLEGRGGRGVVGVTVAGGIGVGEGGNGREGGGGHGQWISGFGTVGTWQKRDPHHPMQGICWDLISQCTLSISEQPSISWDLLQI